MRFSSNSKIYHIEFQKKEKLVSSIDANKLIQILKIIGVNNFPKDWSKLIELTEKTFDWRDYIGKYFLEIDSGNLSNDEFEDRIANLLKAIGFEVTQKGHKYKGEACDGTAIINDSKGEYGIVYDCKNSKTFYPTADDERALEQYLIDEATIHDKAQLYKAFIAKSFRGKQNNDIFYFSVDALLYLLYTKLLLGPKFNILGLRKILDNKSCLMVNNNSYSKSLLDV